MDTLRVVPALLVTLVIAGCDRAPATLTPEHTAAIQDSVRAAISSFQRHAAAGQWDSVATFYTSDSTFRWIENGRVAYGAAVRQTISALPDTLRVESTYDSTQIVPLGPGIALLNTNFQTRFVGAKPPVQFGGAISMLWKHETDGWRIHGGHTSSPPSP